MTRIQVVVPNQGQVDTRLMVWLMQLMHDGRFDLHYAFPIYSPIASARNKVARDFRESPVPFDYLLMVDSDVIPSTNPLDLVERDLDVVGQICPIWKGGMAPGREVMWNVVPLEGSMLIGEGLARVQAVGAGCLLIARRVLEHPAMRAPFAEEYDEDGILVRGEDVAFCHRAREAGFEVWADLGARCSHNCTVDLWQVGNAVLTRRAQPIVSPRLALEGKRLVFCLSPGRCGTRWLAEVFHCVDGVSSWHEPEPNFASVMRQVQERPRLAHQFWLEDKLPAIAAEQCDVYVETSHLFNKGFIEALLDVGVVPDAILIDRSPREVALSYWRRKAIPGRTEMGRKYLVQPDDDGNALPLRDWTSLSDYQLCFWYAMEQRRRCATLADVIEEAGGTVARFCFEKLVGQRSGFEQLLLELGLDEGADWAAFAALNRVYNENPPAIAERRPDPLYLHGQAVDLYQRLETEGLQWD